MQDRKLTGGGEGRGSWSLLYRIQIEQLRLSVFERVEQTLKN